MKAIKTIFKNKGSRAWFITIAVLTAVLIVATVLVSTTFNSILKTVLGGDMPRFDNSIKPIYKSDYSSKRQSKEAGDALNVEIAEEGFTLLLNENKALPIYTPESSAPNKAAQKPKISVFGKNSVNLVLGGSGSGGISGEAAKTLFDGLEAGGFDYNPALKKFYESNGKSGGGRSSNPALTEGAGTAPTLDTGETPPDSYTADIEAGYKQYSDAALVVISRIGGESFDLPRKQNVKNGGIEGNHYLRLDANEYALLDMVTAEFKKVVVILNTLTAFQCDFIAEYNNSADKRIDAVLWIGGPGTTGAMAIGSILNGNVNPSGRTVDIYPKDFTLDPTWVNFGDGSQSSADGLAACKFDGAAQNLVTYEEGIYVGYRYYETRAFTEAQKHGDDRWYEENVIFPFGYGLSYTKFAQRITGFSGGFANENSKISIAVEVENTGGASGRDAVQLYVSLPYYEDGIEKAYVQLVDFAKTDLLAAGGKETITFIVDAYDLASYDYNDANGNGFKGYELDPGDYTFFVSANSHIYAGAYDSRSLTLEAADSIKFDTDPVSGNAVVNRYTYIAGGTNTISAEDDSRSGRLKVSVEWSETLSRIDWNATFPIPLDNIDREITTTEMAKITAAAPNTPESVLAEWEAKGLPATNSEEKTVDDVDADGNAIKRAVTLRDLIGKTYGDPLWSDLLDRLNGQEMLDLVNNGAFQTTAITKIDKNLTNDSDGPIGFINFMTAGSAYKNNTTFASQIVIASAWNKDLAYRMGRAVGDNAVWGAAGGNGLPYSGWYAPAVNIHRSPFSGRNFEYYSEDPVLSGKLAVNIVNGAKTKGVYTDLKHFALNDQETNRSGVATFATEQTIREIYLKPFELAAKGDDAVSKTAAKNAAADGITGYKYSGSNGIMSSFNRIGFVWTGGDYRLMTEILRGEWGFKGLVICDYKTNNYMGSKQMIYGGNDLILTSLPAYTWGGVSAETPDFNNVHDMWALRTATHNILYTVANSNSMNVRITGYIMPWWQISLIVVDIVAVLGFAVWGFFAIRKAFRKKKAKTPNN